MELNRKGDKNKDCFTCFKAYFQIMSAATGQWSEMLPG